MRICVYCASSQMCDAAYHAAATRLGEILAEAGCTIVYGGGAVGLMGSLANGALARGGAERRRRRVGSQLLCGVAHHNRKILNPFSAFALAVAPVPTPTCGVRSTLRP